MGECGIKRWKKFLIEVNVPPGTSAKEIK
uniref:Uncharacterized protein n=1 Tax=Anguilla anguilla TaxID=7936 RepID=A0A0E9QC10_ANGAN